jgi:tRNA pseudouridine55 synthase
MDNALGIINIYKEKGYTSHDVVAIVRKITGTKAGHTGTLDPNAEGVLPICLGRATKLADYIMGQDKTYLAEVVLGVTTDTGDMTGEVLSRNGADIDPALFAKVVAGFHGERWQTPPMYSAIKINGKKLYELARKGQTVERTPRLIAIHKIKTLEGTGGNGGFFIEVDCSKGTYIRSLCADIGAKLGCGAAMGDLTRTRSGMFSSDDAYTIGAIKQATKEGRLHGLILPVDAALPFPYAEVDEKGLAMALNGNPLPLGIIRLGEEAIKYWLRAPDGKLIGLFAVTQDKNRIRAEVML